MKLNHEPTHNAAALLRILDKKIISGEVNPSLLKVLQRKLDAIEQGTADYSGQYPAMLELQALLHLQRTEHAEAEQFLREAAKLSGGTSQLRSRILRQYAEQEKMQINALDLSKLDETERAYLQSYGITEATDIKFFSREGWQFVLLSLVTFGMYDIVWFYKNWRAVKQATGRKMSPFWRAVFVLFYGWPLFKIIDHVGQAKGTDHRFNPGGMLVLYVLMGWAGAAFARVDSAELWGWGGMIVADILGVMTILRVQRTVDQVKAKQGTSYSGYGMGEIVYATLVTIIMALIFAAAFMASWVNTQNNAKINNAEASMSALGLEYDTCSAQLNAEYAFLDETDGAAVDAYNQKYDDCEAVRVRQNQAIDGYNALIEEI